MPRINESSYYFDYVIQPRLKSPIEYKRRMEYLNNNNNFNNKEVKARTPSKKMKRRLVVVDNA